MYRCHKCCCTWPGTVGTVRINRTKRYYRNGKLYHVLDELGHSLESENRLAGCSATVFASQDLKVGSTDPVAQLLCLCYAYESFKFFSLSQNRPKILKSTKILKMPMCCRHFDISPSRNRGDVKKYSEGPICCRHFDNNFRAAQVQNSTVPIKVKYGVDNSGEGTRR